MLKLDLPSSNCKSTLSELCKLPAWSPHKDLWEAAYESYLLHGGNPWEVMPTVFTPDVSESQRALYDTRKRGGPIRRVRDTAHIACCPVCGSQSTGSLDHYLPREVYPEFSIFIPNLVPACANCNSGAKGSTVKEAPASRFLHPYFDVLLGNPIWRLRPVGSLHAVRFEPQPEPWLGAAEAELVAFHLKHVLGKQHALWAETYWANLPQQIRDRLEHAPTMTSADVEGELLTLLRVEVGAGRHNSWAAASLRGIAADVNAIAHIAQRASLLTPTPLPQVSS